MNTKELRIRYTDSEVILQIKPNKKSEWLTDTRYNIIDERVTLRLIEKVNVLVANGWKLVV